MSKKQAADIQQQQAVKAVNLREKLLALPRVMQEGVANYFNMYNCAAWLYNEILSPDAKDYVDQSIQYARELQDLEKATAVAPEKVDQAIQELNHGK